MRKVCGFFESLLAPNVRLALLEHWEHFNGIPTSKPPKKEQVAMVGIPSFTYPFHPWRYRSSVVVFCYSIEALFFRLHFLQSIWIFCIVDEPPFATGIIWSYSRSTSEPQLTHFPPSLFQTAFFTDVGIGLR